MTTVDHHIHQAAPRSESAETPRLIAMIVTLAALAFIGLAALSAPASAPDPEGWHGNSASMQRLDG
ncbi:MULTISPECIES: hypothetical protein [unclassified Mameliella]|uniref:hypothetical protein n=1 Tax=unclassified Mameliella TaxID=2630630 RepID=UPI00273F4153|nr:MULTISPECIES: hypothetical protein [unclassified Mameliella]